MAEGGGNDNKENPFSFRNFVQNKDPKENRTDDGGDFDIFELPDNANQRKREKQRQQLVVEDDVKPKQKKKGKGQNPFSFKQFLASTSNSSNNVKSGTATSSSSQNKNYSQDPVSLLPNIAPDVASDLPDFVQDHFETIPNSSPRGLELPDFTFTNPSSSNSGHGVENSRHLPILLDGNERMREDKEDSDSDTGDCNLAHRSSGTSQKLPDFLSDGAIGGDNVLDVGRGDSFIDGSGVAVVEVNGDLELEVRRLREENNQLRQQLREIRTSHRQEQTSMADLERQIVELKKKELEETAVMEKAIQQVEENLSTTTKRAVSAETTVSKLKQEVRSLQSEMRSLRSENDILRSGDRGLSEVKERSQYVSEQLSSAAMTAENSLRQLLSGVENLRLLSQVLTSIDKISEDRNTGNQHTYPEEHSKVDDT